MADSAAIPVVEVNLRPPSSRMGCASPIPAKGVAALAGPYSVTAQGYDAHPRYRALPVQGTAGLTRQPARK
jgi:hypothetical protein